MSNLTNKIVIPGSFELFAQKIKIQYDEQLGFEKQCYGIADYDKNLILLQPNTNGCERDEDQIEQTYLHEIIHFILNRGGYSKLSKNEDFVDSFSNGLHQVLKSSKYELPVEFVKKEQKNNSKRKKKDVNLELEENIDAKEGKKFPARQQTNNK